MENAKILLAEDDEFVRRVVRRNFEDSTHEIVREESTLHGTIQALEDIRDGHLECDVLLLDGNLSRDSRDCADARIVVDLAHAYELGVKIVSISGMHMPDLGISVDSAPGKHHVDLLPAVVDTL